MSDRPLKRLIKIPPEGGKPNPSAVTEIILEFAEPLMIMDPAGPPNIAALRIIMQFAEMCWNLPLLEKSHDPTYFGARRIYNEALKMMPNAVSRILQQLVEDRKTRFGAVPFFVVLKVTGDNLEDAQVIAETMMPGISPPYPFTQP